MKYKRIAIIFPGQGSQYVGMGKDFWDKHRYVKDIYKRANEVLGYDLKEKCFKKHKLIHRTDLDKTIYTQPAVFVTSYACFRVFREQCKKNKVPLEYSFLAGHSLGEYTALMISGVMDFETALDLVNKRATYITEFSQSYPDAGLMALVDKNSVLDFKKIERLCKKHQVYITINNSKKQVVVGGFKKNLSELSKSIKKDGKLARMLKVEGPFHSPLMKPAADQYKQDLEKADMSIASKPVIANVSTEAIVDPNHIRDELHKQIFMYVDWKSSIEKMVQNGADLFIEVGPKTVLTNMIKDIDSTIPSLNVEDYESLDRTVKELGRKK